MDISDAVFTYSGGAANSSQAVSIGGIKSSVEPVTQQSTLSPISGLTVAEVAGLSTGTALITIDSTHKTVALTPPGGSQGLKLSYDGGGDRSYYLTGSSGSADGYMLVDIVEASLPVVYTSSTVIISTTAGSIFPDITKSQATNGYTQYRCIYLTNNHATQEIARLGIYLLNTTQGQDTIYYAIDTGAGVGDGATTGLAPLLQDETDPLGVLGSLTFESSLNQDTAQMLTAVIPAGSSIPIWIKRVTPPFVSTEVIDNTFTLGIKMYVGA